jgi:hypothetical protein
VPPAPFPASWNDVGASHDYDAARERAQDDDLPQPPDPAGDAALLQALRAGSSLSASWTATIPAPRGTCIGLAIRTTS